METPEISQEKIIADLTKVKDAFLSAKRQTDTGLDGIKMYYQNMATYCNRAIKLIEKQSSLLIAKNSILVSLRYELNILNEGLDGLVSNSDNWDSDDLNDYAEGM